MASSNEMLQYKDLTPAPRLDNKTLNKMVWRSCQLQACFNYERMQSAGWLWAMLPGLQKIHTNKEDLAASMTHNLDFLNTHPFAVTFVMGMVLSMEQQKMDIQTIRSVRISVAAPLGGIGDALFWMTLIPIVAGMTAQMAMDGSWIGPILYFIIAFGVEMALRYGLMYWSYNMGTKAVTMMTAHANEITHAASVLGVFVIGALIANYGGGTSLAISIPNGESTIVIQDYLNKILTCVVCIKLCFTVLSVVVLALFFSAQPGEFLIYFIFLASTVFNALLPDYMYRGLERMSAITVRTVSVKLFATLMIAVFMRGNEDAYMVPLFTAVGNFTTWVTGILKGFGELHQFSLELSSVRGYIEAPEPFRMEGFTVGSDEVVRRYLVNRARTFIFTTALPPVCAAWTEQSRTGNPLCMSIR